MYKIFVEVVVSHDLPQAFVVDIVKRLLKVNEFVVQVFLVKQVFFYDMSLVINGWIFFRSLPSSTLAVSYATPLMLSVRTFMSSSKRFRANLPRILALTKFVISGFFNFSMSNRIRGLFW